jgi:hypothetical protein
MNLDEILNELRQQSDRITNAIAALEGITSEPHRRRGRPPKAHRQRRHMSAAARERISVAMKQRWAKWKGKSGPKQVKAASKESGRRAPMSAAAKKRLSVLMKARWAERKGKT